MHLRSFLLLLVAALLAAPARSQIVLPGKKAAGGGSGGDVAPYYECLTCGARNYEVHDEGRRDDAGHVIAWCGTCKRDTSQVLPAASAHGANGSGRLVLPPGATAAPPSGATIKTSAAASKAAPVRTAAKSSATAGPADFIYAELRKARRPDENLTQRAVESLLALGEDGLAAARGNLGDDDAGVLMTSARVLLRSGRPEDADLVIQRMRGRLPVAAGGPLLDLLVRSDPVRASPKLLAELLDHPHVGIRIEAQRRLLRAAADSPVGESATGEPTGLDLVALLEPALSSKRADTRRRAVEILATVEGPEATRTILDHVADPAGAVVAAVVDALATRTDPDLDQKLVGMAFRERWVLRTGACALLALAEREDREPRPILLDSNVEPLLAGLQSGDPFLSGSCAVALAGIGFRSRDTARTPWLDQDVVDRLVSTISGRTFHADLPALAGPALRRAELLTGQTLGTDGPRWIEWWIHAREGFYARRAWLEVRPEDVARIEIRYDQGGGDRLAFRLLGPENDAAVDRAGLAASRPEEEAFRLDLAQARGLVESLNQEGVFGPEKLPGSRGSRGESERTLQVLVGNRGKRFTFGAGAVEPWFERAVALARELVERNRWQRYPDPARHLSTHELWEEQSAWWAEEHTEAERGLRMKSLVLAALPARSDAARDGGIAELERIYGQAGAEPADFPALAGLLATEPYWAERARRLLALALKAAGTRRAIGEEGGEEGGAEGGATATADASIDIPPERGRVLVDLLLEHFTDAPPEEIARVFSACGPSLAQTMASDPRAPVRIAAARALCADRPGSPADEAPSPQALEILMRLLGDPDSTVEVAAVEALGQRKVEAAPPAPLAPARLGLPPVRAAALRAIGRLRGELVLDALSLAATDRDPTIRLAAAQGLADLAAPGSASLLIEMLGEGDGTPTVEAARAGLEALGPAAHESLLRVVHSPSQRGRREAALILSRQAVPEAASALIAMLSTSTNDAHVASELAVLTGVDLRGEADPAGAWWGWWDGVVHDDATAWFLAALARAGANPPARTDLEGSGTRAGRLFLLEVIARRESHLVERARRELSRMLGHDVGALPARGEERDAWIAAQREAITEPEPK